METVSVINNQEIAPGIYSITFRKFFDFIPGQVVKITTHADLEPRLYSIASGVNDEDIQLVYDIKPEGELTNILKNLHSGSELMVSLPFGQFTCTDDNAWWIATGTGIAPFYSMMRSGRVQNITLIHGVRNFQHFLFQNEFSGNLQANYKRCCSASRVEGVFYGRVTEYIRNLEKLPPKTSYYLCGSAEMVVDVRDLLIEKGVDYGRIFSEIYF